MSFEDPLYRPEANALEMSFDREDGSANADTVPTRFEKDNVELFEPEYMRVLSPHERQKSLQELFTHKMMNWLEDPSEDIDLEAALRQSETMREMTRWVSRTYVEMNFITEEQRSAKLKAIGLSDPS